MWLQLLVTYQSLIDVCLIAQDKLYHQGFDLSLSQQNTVGKGCWLNP
tara:strand:+ start:1301 stop:1441 length:141 start_codon:yes stop_codon:yes gene_type:complete